MAMRIYERPLVIAYSGGKDSSVCLSLAQRAGIPMEVLHNHTTADAPETVRFVRQELKRLEALGIKCELAYPRYKGQLTSMWALIPQKLTPPTRRIRYCCEILKEQSGRGRYLVTGVRWEESTKRRMNRGVHELLSGNSRPKIILNNDNSEQRRLFETCSLKAKRMCNPIIDWSTREIWDYIRSEHLPINPIYDCGFNRVGCVGCPMAGKFRYTEFARWPKYRQLYLSAFDRMLLERRRRGKTTGIWKTDATAEDVMHWWLEDGILPGQYKIAEMEDYFL